MSDQDNVSDDTPNVAVDDSVSDTDNNDNTNDSANESDDVEKLREQNKKLFERAKKAEGFVKDENGNWLKKPKPAPKTETQAVVQSKGDNFDLEDVAVLVSAVPLKEDREVVKKYAKVEGKTLEEALNDPIVKGILKERAELRKTADATNTTGSRRTTAKVTDEQVVERFKEGKSFDPEALAEARINLKKAGKR